MSEQLETKQEKMRSVTRFFAYAAGPFLVAYLLLLLGTTYLSQQDLQEASYNSLLFNLEKRASALSYFNTERRNDISALAKDRALGVFFSNHALGMSMEYGLRASLLSMQKKFQDLVDGKRIDSAPIYLRLLFTDNQGKQLADVGVASGTYEHWTENEVLATEESKSIILQHEQHNHFVLRFPYLYKGEKMGIILAEVNYSEVVHQLIHPKMLGQAPYAILMRSSKRVLNHEHSDKRHIDSDSMYLENIPDQSSREYASYLKMPVSGSPFILAARHPEESSSDFLTSPWYLFSLGVLALLVLYSVAIGIRTRMRNLLLHTRFEESEQQSRLLNEHNIILEEEARKRRDSETRLQILIETLPDLVWLKDTDGIYLACNHKFERFFGAKQSEIVGKTDYDFVDKELADFFRNKDMIAIAAAKPSINEEEVTYADDGHRELLETIKTPMLDSDSILIGVLGVGRDITERKQGENALRESEARYHELMDNMSDGVAVYEAVEDGRDFVFREYNKAGEQIGRIPRDQVIGHCVTEIFPGIEALGLLDVFRRVWQTGQPEYFPMTYYKDRRINFWVENHVFKIPSGEIVAVYSDITERKQAENEKGRLQRELEQAHKMEALGQLTGGIAHDFNNILGIIMGYTGMALGRYGHEAPDKVVDYLETAMKASERAKELVAQMLTFSRSGNEDAQALQFAPQVKENIKMLHSILPSSIKTEFNAEDNLPSILMDPAKLQQLIMNLCVNAKDAMDGVGTLTISLGWQRGVNTECTACHQRVKGDWIELSVADTGSGMTPETIKHLFEPFYTTKEIGKGTGMGMAVLHGIVSGHGGHTLVETELGKGTTFRLLFPPVIEKAPETSEAAPSSNELPQGEGREVLVVDDEAGLAEYIGDLLELYGYRSTIKTDSQEALSLLQENPDKFALLVTDQTMPRLTGVELIEQFRQIRQDFPIILCTGYSESIDKESAERRGVRYLGKPIDANKLIQSAGELLGLTKK